MIKARKASRAFKTVGIAEARKCLPELTTTVEMDQSEAVELCRRDVPAALLVSYDRYSELIRVLSRKAAEKDPRRGLLAWAVTDRWLDQAPAHLRDPQFDELHRLTTKALFALFMANVDRPAVVPLLKEGVHARTLQRLMKRRAVARAIQEAEAEGLYDVAEHAASAAGFD